MKRVTQQFLLWGGLVVVLGLIVWGLYAASQNSGTSTSTSVAPVTSADHVLGPRSAKAVLIEYGDFECPACGQWQPIINALKEKYGDRLALVFREYPLPQHQYGQLAAQAAEAANLQDSFWAMHDLLYARQDSWANSLNAKPVFIGYAQELGLNVTKFKQDLDSQAVKDRITADIQTGNAAKIPGTPTFFFNGKEVTGATNSVLTQLIDQALGS